jgi:amidase
MDELTGKSALELAGLVAKREVSCTEVVEAHLARIEAVNGAVNAVVRLLADSARAEAAGLDGRLAAGEPVGPLAGVPITVKENIDMAGLPTTWGVPALAEAVVPVDAPVVERMRAAGAIPIGRTNLPDMALRLHTDSSLHGATVNPWNPGRTPGGSSGGDAVALATGMAALALGNDIGGSLRNPANACGIASIRPSIGRVPDAGFVPAEDALLAFQLFNVQGPMARRVADVRAALEVLSGAHPRDPWSLTMPFEVTAPRPIRVAMVAEPPGGATDPVVAAAVRAAGQRLVDAGYTVEEITPPRYSDAVETWTQIILGDLASALPLLQSIMGEPGRVFLETVFAALPPPSDTGGMSAAFSTRHGIARAWAGFLAEWPLVLSPTWSQLPFAPGFDAASPENALAVMEGFRPVIPANLMGLPSACVPAVHDDASGLPIGVLLTGARYHDALCLDAAEVIEAGSPVRTPIDPVSA